MREIKFKVRVTSDIEVDRFGAILPAGEWITYYPETFPIMWKDKLDLNTRRQYTGLTDKNGVEIYEGDILKTADQQVATVCWNEGGAFFDLATPDDDDMSIDWLLSEVINDNPTGQDMPEVVGNIYENPELLEQTNG